MIRLSLKSVIQVNLQGFQRHAGTFFAENGVIVRRADQVRPGETLAIRVAEAELEAVLQTARSTDRVGKVL